MTSPLDGIIPTTINISLEKREPPAPPPPPVPLVLDQHNNHYVVEGEGASGIGIRAAEVQQPVQAPAAQVTPVQGPPAPAPAPAPAFVATPVTPVPVVEPEPAPAQHFAEPIRPAVPPPAPSPVVATPVQAYYAPPQETHQTIVDAPTTPAAVPAPPAAWPPADAMEGFDVEPEIASGPLFTQHKSSIRPMHVFAVLGVLVVGTMAVISYLWISEKYFAAPASQVAVKAAAQPAAAEQQPVQQQAPKEAEILEQSLPEPVVITSAPASAAVPPAPAPAPAPKTVAPPPAPKVVAPAKPAPAAATPVRAPVQPPAAPPVVQLKPEPRATAAVQQPSPEPSTSDRQSAGGRGWAMRVERNGVLFFVDGKANLYRVGDSLPNGERLVDVDESSATYATDKGVRQVRSSPLQHSK